MKCNLLAISYRLLETISMLLIIINCDLSVKLLFGGFLFISTLTGILLFSRPESTFFFENRTKLVLGISIFLVAVCEFFVFSGLEKIFSPVYSVLVTRFSFHPLKSLLFTSFLPNTGGLFNRIFQYPVPLLKESKWILKKEIGAAFQKYAPTSRLTQYLLINTSYFFRDAYEYESKIVDYLSNNNVDKIRILNAGCSSGQEAYSIAIFCHKRSIKYHIDAFDLSEYAIEKAKTGEFSFKEEESLIKRSGKADALTKLYENKKFLNLSEDLIRIGEFIKDNINFYVSDIVDFNAHRQYDFIIVRKVLYYIPKEKIESVLAALKKALREGLPEENIIIDDYSRKSIRKHLGRT